MSSLPAENIKWTTMENCSQIEKKKMDAGY